MDGYVLVIPICMVLVAVAVVKWITNKEKSENMTEKYSITIAKEKDDNTSGARADVKSEKKIEDKSGYAIRYSNDYGSQTSETKMKPKHEISVILKDGVHEKKWICPDCEAENHMADSRCCVCNCYPIR